MKQIVKKTLILKATILAKKEELFENLLAYESWTAFEDEYNRTIDCLSNILFEQAYLKNTKVNQIACFLPVNLPLYSLVLFAIIPSFMAQNVYVRAPKSIKKAIKDLYDILDIQLLFPNIKLSELEKTSFVNAYASLSDVVIFTGQYSNALNVMSKCDQTSLFIYNGAGQNPMIIGKRPNLNQAVAKIIQARTFNSGQDCAGPDCILVHASVSATFITLLKKSLEKLSVGEYSDKDVQIGRILNTDFLPEIASFLDKNQKDIFFGGKIDKKSNIVHPTILVSLVKDKQHYFEPFSPIFNISVYNNDSELDYYFANESYYDYAMYASIFGETTYSNIKNTVLLNNEIILDIEKGNFAYGGYGSKANFIRRNGVQYSIPILISEQIYNWKNNILNL